MKIAKQVFRCIADAIPFISWHVIDGETGRTISKHKRFSEAQDITDMLNSAVTE